MFKWPVKHCVTPKASSTRRKGTGKLKNKSRRPSTPGPSARGTTSKPISAYYSASCDCNMSSRVQSTPIKEADVGGGIRHRLRNYSHNEALKASVLPKSTATISEEEEEEGQGTSQITVS